VTLDSRIAAALVRAVHGMAQVDREPQGRP
jgi:hypothetical protein